MAKIIKAELSEDKKAKSKNTNTIPKVSLEPQQRLAEILNDTPRLVALHGTEWEVRALRMGTQWLIAQKCVEVAQAETKNYADIMRQFAVNIPAVLDVLTLCLLNDKDKIYKDGDERKGFSDLYYSTRNTLEWDCNVREFSNLLVDCLQLMSVDFFFESADMLEIFRKNILEAKRMRIAARK